MKIGEAILKNYERVMQLPNVMGISIGKCAEIKVIKIFVLQKQPESRLQSNEIIPNSLEGFLTDVVEIGAVAAQATYPCVKKIYDESKIK
ncbi:MAG: hypothetical protein ACQ9ET_02585 [Nitrosomonadaceae bacterium]